MHLEFTIVPEPLRNAAESRRDEADLRARLVARTQVLISDTGAITKVEPLHVDRPGNTQVIARPQVSGELDGGPDGDVAMTTEPGRPALVTTV